MKIVVHIERLVLDGLLVTSAQGAHVGAALERELARLLAADAGVRRLQGGAVPRVGAPAIALAQQPRPAEIGRQIAQSVYTGIGADR